MMFCPGPLGFAKKIIVPAHITPTATRMMTDHRSERFVLIFFIRRYRLMSAKTMNAIAIRRSRVMRALSGVAYKLSVDWSNAWAMLDVAAVASPA